jgi:2-iminobutanoate/2-iminopropanoate deaminase
MPRFFNPQGVALPASNYNQGAIYEGPATRLIISGQVGVRLDGSIPGTLEEQMEVAWDNLAGVLAGGGMSLADLVKITAFVTVPASVGLFRAVRDRRLLGHAPACTYIEVSGLASPAFLMELEGEAVQELNKEHVE